MNISTNGSTRIGELIWAVLVLIQHWIAEGRPLFTERTLGTFEAWAETVGGILAAAGISGFLENVTTFTAGADEESMEWSRFVRGWWHQHQNRPVEARDLLPLARVFLSEIAHGRIDEHAQLTRLGIALRKHREWVIDAYQIMTAEFRDDRGRERHGWALRAAGSATLIAGAPNHGTPAPGAAERATGAPAPVVLEADQQHHPAEDLREQDSAKTSGAFAQAFGDASSGGLNAGEAASTIDDRAVSEHGEGAGEITSGRGRAAPGSPESTGSSSANPATRPPRTPVRWPSSPRSSQ